MTRASALMSRAAAAFLGVTLALSAAPAAQAACTTVVCLAPGPQTTNFGGGNIRTSTGVYRPISLWNMGGGNYDIAIALPPRW